MCLLYSYFEINNLFHIYAINGNIHNSFTLCLIETTNNYHQQTISIGYNTMEYNLKYLRYQ